MIQDTELVQRAKTRDEAAFAELVRRYQKRCYNLAWQMTQNEHDAQELTQEAFLRVWRALPQFEMQSSFSTWLYSLTSHVCIDFLRAKGRKKQTSLDPEWDMTDPAPGPEEQTLARERRQMVQKAMAELPEDQRLILTLRVLQDLSYAEISEITGLREGTVKSRLARAREKMRRALGNEIGSGSSNQAERG